MQVFQLAKSLNRPLNDPFRRGSPTRRRKIGEWGLDGMQAVLPAAVLVTQENENSSGVGFAPSLVIYYVGFAVAVCLFFGNLERSQRSSKQVQCDIYKLIALSIVIGGIGYFSGSLGIFAGLLLALFTLISVRIVRRLDGRILSSESDDPANA